MATVIQFPSMILCSECMFAFMGPLGIHCGCYNEDIVDEEEARSCSEFRPY